jgi:hypothetical protein
MIDWSVSVYSQYDGLVSSEVRTRPSREIELDVRALHKLEKRFFNRNKSFTHFTFKSEALIGWLHNRFFLQLWMDRNNRMRCPTIESELRTQTFTLHTNPIPICDSQWSKLSSHWCQEDPKTRFCRDIWLCLLCVYTSSYVYMSSVSRYTTAYLQLQELIMVRDNTTRNSSVSAALLSTPSSNLRSETSSPRPQPWVPTLTSMLSLSLHMHTLNPPTHPSLAQTSRLLFTSLSWGAPFPLST